MGHLLARDEEQRPLPAAEAIELELAHPVVAPPLERRRREQVLEEHRMLELGRPLEGEDEARGPPRARAPGPSGIRWVGPPAAGSPATASISSSSSVRPDEDAAPAPADQLEPGLLVGADARPRWTAGRLSITFSRPDHLEGPLEGQARRRRCRSPRPGARR